MKNHTPLLGLICTLGALTLPASGATYFLPGVTKESGWHDAEKEWNGVDDNMCWAAQASCMAQYWQDCYVKAGNTLPAGTPNSASDIFDVFKSSWTNVGSNADFGVPWYFTGMTNSDYWNYGYYKNPYYAKLTDFEAGGYFAGLYQSTGTTDLADDFMLKEGFKWHSWQGNMYIEDFTETLMRLITVDYSIVGLSLHFWDKYGRVGGHAVTLWGFETDDTSGEVSAVYITDSDDNQTALVRYEVDGHAQLGYDVELPYYLNEAVRTKYVTAIDSFYSLSVARFIPEPSMFGLLAGMLALGASGTRRRRKKA